MKMYGAYERLLVIDIRYDFDVRSRKIAAKNKRGRRFRKIFLVDVEQNDFH